MFKKKNGYTLIELIVVLGILSIIISITSMNVIKIKNIICKITLEESVNEVRSILSFGKNYCRKNGVNGIIAINNNKLSLIINEKGYNINKSTEVKAGLEIDSNFGDRWNSRIDKDGYINIAGKIVLRMGDIYREIKIGVGNDIIGVSEVDIIE